MKRIFINIDGGARRNPGPAAIAAIFYNEKGQEIKSYGEYIGQATNNEAEYQAAIFALKKFKQLFGKKLAKETDTELRTDAEFLTKQMKGEYKVEEPHIQKLFLQLWNLKIEFPKLKIKLISRDKNKTADKLVNQTLDRQAREQKLF